MYLNQSLQLLFYVLWYDNYDSKKMHPILYSNLSNFQSNQSIVAFMNSIQTDKILDIFYKNLNIDFRISREQS